MNKIIYPCLALFLSCAQGLAMAAEQKQLSKEEQDARAFEKMFPAGAPSESDVYRADELLISATGSLKPVRLAPSVATVITAAKIEAIGASTLDEILQAVPGLHAAPSGYSLLSSNWSIRGMRTNTNPQVLLLINGVPMNHPINGERALTYHMPVAMISRVEVVRGPGSAVHGADAFAGTINVITKDGHEVDGTRMGLRGGSFDTYDAWLQHGGTYGGWDMVFGIEGRKTQGDKDRIVDRDRLGSGVPSATPGALDTRSQQVDFHLGFNKDDRWGVKFYGAMANDNAMGPGGLQIVNDESFHDSDQFMADLSYHSDDLAPDWDLTLRATYYYLKQNNDFQLIPSSVLNMRGNPSTANQTSNLEATGIYDGFNGHHLRFTGGYKYYETETDEEKNFPPFPPGISSVPLGPMVNFKDSPYIFMKDQDRSLWYLSFQEEWQLAKGWVLTAGIRYDDYSDFGSTTNPRLALVWESTPTLTSKLLYGRAFRAPAFTEMYINYNPVTAGNTDIDPETIDTYELAFVWEPTVDLSITPSAFYYQIDGLIAMGGGSPLTYDNRGDQKGHGFELEAQWRALETLVVEGNLAYQRSKDQGSDAPVADTPEWQTYLSATWEFLPEWSLNGQHFWVAERHRAVGDPREDIADYNFVNLTLRRQQLFKHCDLAISVRNLFDEDIREPSPYDSAAPDGAWIANDIPLEGRSLWAELRFHF